MTENYTKLVNLPPGWDVKYDSSTGKCYYINYLTKVMQLEDPRVRYKQFQNERCSTESIPLQPMHGSPYHVYPTNNFPAVKAFQGPHPSLQNVSASPLLSTKSQLSSAMEMSQGSSPQNPRTGSLSRRQSTQETSFTNQIDTDVVVSKIQTMFPTAGENHIRLLLKKYYNREAVVISALQVEKHPVTMPGPFATPPAQRHLFHSTNSTFHMTPPARRWDLLQYSTSPRTGSPIPGRPGSITSSCIGGLLYGSPRIGEQIRNSPKPHSSPKMKLRYMKSIFPKAEETLLLDILANSDNNVQKASEKLLAMGYTKREVTAPKLSNREEEKRHREKIAAAEKIIPLRPIELTDEEKSQIKIRLQNRYNKIAERIILMALESVNYSEDRAKQILQIVQQEDECRARKDAENEINRAIDSSIQEELHSVKERNSPKGSTEDETDTSQSDFKSILGRIATLGHNNELANGPDDSLLLADYITWNGANPDNSSGRKTIANGSDSSILSDRSTTYTSHGRNIELCKGPKIGLAKGSIYSQLSTNNNIKCN